MVYHIISINNLSFNINCTNCAFNERSHIMVDRAMISMPQDMFVVFAFLIMFLFGFNIYLFYKWHQANKEIAELELIYESRDD